MLVLDAGALLAVERSDRETIALLTQERVAGRSALTHAGVLGQVWRGGQRRQANLARFLPALLIRPLDEDLGRRAGVLLGRARKSDVIDAAVVLLASDGDVILTSDPRDLRPLADAAGVYVDLVSV
jgi:predicted nucleic acid-binding protein